MTAEVRDDRFRQVVGALPEVERLASGFLFTEGPVWHSRDKYLIFSDMPGDHMRRWSERGGIETFRKPCNMANGNTYDSEGRLLTCEHATSRVTRTGRDGKIDILATHWNGKELNSPNDIVVKSDSSIWFTDPTYGRLEYYGVLRKPELSFRGAYRIAPNGELSLLADDFGQPNGLCFSPDEKRLFINDTERNHIRVFDVGSDGRISNGRVWAELTGSGDGAADGMKIDAEGNLYSCGPGGIHVFDDRANCLGVIQFPEVAANFCWGGDDLRSLYVTASTSLYCVRVKTPGRATF